MSNRFRDRRTIDDLWDEQVDAWAAEQHRLGVEEALLNRLRIQGADLLKRARREGAERASDYWVSLVSEYCSCGDFRATRLTCRDAAIAAAQEAEHE